MRVKRISGRIVDVLKRIEFSGTIEYADGVITRVYPDPKVRERSLIMPGLVDAHIHVESSMLPPTEFARLAVVHGTVGTVSDPHEIANVLGLAGVDYMLAEARRTPFKFCFGAPSCVPATAFETAGAVLGTAAVARLLERKQIGYLTEVMNFPAVLRHDPEVLAKIAAARRLGKPVDGHAPGLRGPQAMNYAAAGITTDHECSTLAEAKDKLRAGMIIQIREGSAARNYEALGPLLKTHPDRCMFCCDDLHPDLLVRHHLDSHVRRALALGADRFDVLACASLNPIQHYRLGVGLLREGDPADFIVVSDWKRFRVLQTHLEGRLVAANGRSRLPRLRPRIVNRFRANPRRASDFAVIPGKGRMNVIEALNGQLVTRARRVKPTLRDGFAVANRGRDVLKIAVINRYASRQPPAVAFIHGFGLRAGAMASSVAHDSHNVIAVGVDDDSLAAAVNLVIRHRGGISAVGRGQSLVLPLPIAGLMSAEDGYRVAARYTELDRLAKRLGSKLDAPFMTLAFMALLVIPDLKLSDRGLFSGQRWAFQSLFSE